MSLGWRASELGAAHARWIKDANIVSNCFTLKDALVSIFFWFVLVKGTALH
jgi:hypothetical protein